MRFFAKRTFQVCKGKAFVPFRSQWTLTRPTELEERKVFSGSEARMLYSFIRDKKQNLMATTGVNASDDSKAQGFDDVLEMMASKINELPFSGMTRGDLEYLNIHRRGDLILKPNTSSEELLEPAKRIGDDQIWSSEWLYRHICMLQGFVAEPSKPAAAHMWIDAFLLRAATMAPRDKKIMLHADNHISGIINRSSTAVLKGFMQYAAIMGTPIEVARFVQNPTLEGLQEFKHALYISETKDDSLQKDIPQAVSELYAWAKELGKTTARGALSNGQQWIFFILKINSDRNGAIYAASKEIPFVALPDLVPSRDACATISGILSYWIEHGNKDISDNDWFTVRGMDPELAEDWA